VVSVTDPYGRILAITPHISLNIHHRDMTFKTTVLNLNNSHTSLPASILFDGLFSRNKIPQVMFSLLSTTDQQNLEKTNVKFLYGTRRTNITDISSENSETGHSNHRYVFRFVLGKTLKLWVAIDL
jgi:hypothetical protein